VFSTPKFIRYYVKGKKDCRNPNFLEKEVPCNKLLMIVKNRGEIFEDNRKLPSRKHRNNGAWKKTRRKRTFWLGYWVLMAIVLTGRANSWNVITTCLLAETAQRRDAGGVRRKTFPSLKEIAGGRQKREPWNNELQGRMDFIREKRNRRDPRVWDLRLYRRGRPAY